MRAELRVVEGKQKGATIPLNVRKFLIGREQDCHLRPNSELVSRHHCVITLDGFTVRLRDLGSTNGTFVNEERVSTPVILKSGDKVQVGKLAFEIVIVEEPVEVGAPDTAPSMEDTMTGEDTVVTNPQPVADLQGTQILTQEQLAAHYAAEQQAQYAAQQAAYPGAYPQQGYPQYPAPPGYPQQAYPPQQPYPPGAYPQGYPQYPPQHYPQPYPMGYPQMPGYQAMPYPQPQYQYPQNYPMSVQPYYQAPPSSSDTVMELPTNAAKAAAAAGDPGRGPNAAAATGGSAALAAAVAADLPAVRLPDPETTGAKAITIGSDPTKKSTEGGDPRASAAEIIKQFRQQRPIA